jgi:hypothetical protein
MKRDRMVLVEWNDAASTDGWRDRDAAVRDMTPLRCCSVGYVLKSTRQYIVMAASTSESGNVSQVGCIPRTCIYSIKELEAKK